MSDLMALTAAELGAELATELAAARRDGVALALTADIPLDQARRLQVDAFALRGVPVAGYKIGLTGQGIRTALGAEEPAMGRLAAGDVIAGGAVALQPSRAYYAEGEVVFTMARTLEVADAPFSAEAVAAAVGPVQIGIELVTSRFEPDDVPLGLLVADNCMAERLILGDTIAQGWDERLADWPMTIAGPGAGRGAGSTAAVMGNPLTALTWLANALAAEGIALAAGQIVSSGTCTGVTPVQPGDTIRVELAGLGAVQANFVSVS